jgi:hypothetical protein
MLPKKKSSAPAEPGRRLSVSQIIFYTLCLLVILSMVIAMIRF